MLWTIEATIFIRMLARASMQRKQPYLWFMANNNIICNEDTAQTTTFWFLAKAKSMYNLQRQQLIWFHCAKVLISLCNWNNSNNNFSYWQQDWFDLKDNPYNLFFVIISTDLCTLCNKEISNAFCSY